MCWWPCCGTVAVSQLQVGAYYNISSAVAMYKAARRTNRWFSTTAPNASPVGGAQQIVAFSDGSALGWSARGKRGVRSEGVASVFASDGSQTQGDMTTYGSGSGISTHALPWGDGMLATTVISTAPYTLVYVVERNGTIVNPDGVYLGYEGRLFDSIGSDKFLANNIRASSGSLELNCHLADLSTAWTHTVSSGVYYNSILSCFAPDGGAFVAYSASSGGVLRITRLSNTGSVLWTRNLDGTDSSGAECRDTSVASYIEFRRQARCDMDGNLYIPCLSADSTGNRYLQKLDSTTGIPKWVGEPPDTPYDFATQYGHPEFIDVAGRYVWSTTYDQMYYVYDPAVLYPAGSIRIYDRETGEQVQRIKTVDFDTSFYDVDERPKVSRYWTSLCVARS